MKALPPRLVKRSAEIMFERGAGTMNGWPVLHLHHVRRWTEHSEAPSPADGRSRLEDGIAFLPVSASSSALKMFNAASTDALSEMSRGTLAVVRGLAYWRRGDTEDALTALRPLALGERTGGGIDAETNATRIYVEVARDL